MSGNERLAVPVGGFDVIGDIHGVADALHRLLAQLHYVRNEDSPYQHPGDRAAVFVGDFIDRGPQQREVLSVVRKMVSSGRHYAVMGDHELNAIAYATPNGEGGHFRQHTEAAADAA
jgi:hypothetical protein